VGASDLWYKNAVIYALDVETFQDSDGVGDFPGLIDRLDYLERLGVDCLWLLPFYPSPNRDNGYDVIDYYDVDPRLGNLGDFVEFVHEANARGIKVLIDLVVNHTSNEHPWFQAARQDPDSTFRDYYVWTDDPPPRDPTRGPVFPGEQDDVWTYDELADAYYFHRFYYFQPDLNIANPDVREEIHKIMGFWLQLGVSGFRVDAATLMIDQKGLVECRPENPHGVLKDMRAFAARRGGDAVLLAEADDEPHELSTYFGDGDEMNLLMNFLLDAYLVAALATEEAELVEQVLDILPEIPEAGQWANFLRNHTNSTSGGCPLTSANASSRCSHPRRACASSVAASAGGSRRCSTATATASNLPTACCSRCPGRPCSSTATRSAWARTSTSPAGTPPAPRCSGPTQTTAGSRPRPRAI
jgi:maltose alpha-D-glucosyltransferase/alpha-amylase